MIEVENLTKHYGYMRGITNLNFTVKKGQILGFLGPNGAGKSTTMNIISGFIHPTEGTVKICGYDISEQPRKAKKCIGYLPEQPPICMDMTVLEYLNFVSDLKMVDKKIKPSQLKKILELTKIYEVRGRLIRNLSKGYKQRVGIAQALVGNPEVIILDEPTVGLDPKQIIEIRNLIKSLGKEHTVLLSSHILPEINAVCDEVIIINNGKIVAIDTPENLKDKLETSYKFSMTILGPKDDVLELLKKIDGIKHIKINDKKSNGAVSYTIEADKGIDVKKSINENIITSGYEILELKSEDLSLEDIFLELVTPEASDKKEAK